MCGICGFINFNDHDTSKDLNIMMSNIAHRGPDTSGIFVNNELKLNLGHLRLSILDLTEKGNQPMFSSNNSFIIIFNGEIYNHIQLKEKFFPSSKIWKSTSDTEVLLECIQLIGLEKTLLNLDGMFAFALYDFVNKNIYLARDRFGEKPLYYVNNEKILYFASELNSLKNIGSINKTLDLKSIQHLLNFSYIPKNKSIYREIKQIEPGVCLKFSIKNEKVSSSERIHYWNTVEEIYSAINSPYKDEKVATQEVEDQLVSTINSRLVSDVEVGTFFSGGVDSTLVTCMASNLIQSKLKSYTIGFHDSQYDETDYAKKIASSLNIQLKDRKINDSDIIEIIPKLNDIYSEPFADSSQIPTYFLSKLTYEDGIKVVLTGDGGDEFFGGYNRYFLTNKIKFLSKIPYFARKVISELFLILPINFWTYIFLILQKANLINQKIPNFNLKVLKFLKLLKFKNIEDMFQIILRTLDLTEVLKNNFNNLDIVANDINKFENLEDFMMYFDTVNYLPGDILTKVDRATMSNSIESRAPFLDHKLFRKAWKLGGNLKINDQSGKVVLKNILSKKIDYDLFNRPKMGFGIPLDSILKNQLKDWCYESLNSNILKQFEFFDLQKIEKLKVNYFEKNIGSYVSLWNLLILSDWLKKNE